MVCWVCLGIGYLSIPCRIRWQQAVDLAAEDYFNVNAVLSYLVRINLVARWTQLDEARGRAMLGRLLRELDGKELINNK